MAAEAHRATRRDDDPANLLRRRLAETRAQTLRLIEGLSAEDCQAQSMADASPVKWHLAHTTWFFETLLLERAEAGFRPFDPAHRVLFNSYYNAVGERHPRPQRGLLTRPALAEVLDYRAQVDARVDALLRAGLPADLQAIVELGLQHEQQHQELILTDLKHLFGSQPTLPVYRPPAPAVVTVAAPLSWVAFEGGPAMIGHAGSGFCFDNETPRHRVHLESYALANRPVTQGEWLEFIADGGYRDPRWWLSAGWDWVQAGAIAAPLYWQRDGAGASGHEWQVFTLHGQVAPDPATPVAHVSLFEADAFCRWKAAADERWSDARLPTEAEWERAAVADDTASESGGAAAVAAGHFVETGVLHPLAAHARGTGLQQLFGGVWEWTSSSYAAYPGYRPWAGAVGEYNGKFMVNQYVLRGGSCATPRSHIRATYRNFFPADARWQFSGLRMARSL